MATVCEKENLDSTGVCDQIHLHSELPSLFDLSNEDFQSGKSANAPITVKMKCIKNCFFRQMDESVKSVFVPEGECSGASLNFLF